MNSARATLTFIGPIRRPWPEQSREVDIGADVTLQQLLVGLGYKPADLAVLSLKINGQKAFASTAVKPGDRIEIRMLIGGG